MPLPSCKKKYNNRYINENDSLYSLDIRNISKKINESPENPELYYRRANTFYFEDNFNQALLDINYALKLDSINPLYYYKKSSYLMSGDTADATLAEKNLQKAIQLKPDFIDAMADLAKIYLAKQRYDQSEALYQRINKIDPSNPIPYFYLGIISKEIGDTTKAIQLFEKVLIYDDKHYDAVMQLGNIYANWHDKKALDLFSKALKINPYSDEAQYAIGLFLQKDYKYKDAVKYYESVAKLNPAHIFCRYNLAYIHGLFENYKKAIEYLDQAIDLAPDYAEAYTLRGTMKEKSNNSTGAYNDFKMALQLDPKQKLAEEGLSRINITISMP
ncbi:MAG: tetratricopeptide repeat protein [Bacteroidia bacterium]|nr:tetratricopeptide repeat protein [Bacteroidia bacterium]